MNPGESAVRNLLRMAGLRLTDAEVAEFVKAFPFHRRMVETLYSVATGVTVEQAETEFAGGQYGAFKTAVAEAMVEFLRPVRERYAELSADPGEVERILATGAGKAQAIAERTMERVRTATGILLPGKG